MPRHRVRQSLALAALMGVLGTNVHAAVQQSATSEEPLVIAKQGSFFVGGELVFCPANDGSDINNNPRFPPGHVVINQLYAQFQVPVHQSSTFP